MTHHINPGTDTTINPARQPQQEYIITKEDYDQIYSIEYPLTSEERRRICERAVLHTSPPAPASCPAQDVLDFAIKDLEREIKDQQWMIDNYKGHHKEIHENISKALRYALNLLRGNNP